MALRTIARRTRPRSDVAKATKSNVVPAGVLDVARRAVGGGVDGAEPRGNASVQTPDTVLHRRSQLEVMTMKVMPCTSWRSRAHRSGASPAESPVLDARRKSVAAPLDRRQIRSSGDQRTASAQSAAALGTPRRRCGSGNRRPPAAGPFSPRRRDRRRATQSDAVVAVSPITSSQRSIT